MADNEKECSNVLEKILHIVRDTEHQMDDKKKQNEEIIKNLIREQEIEYRNFSENLLISIKQELEEKKEEFSTRLNIEFESAKSILDESLQTKTIESLMIEMNMFNTIMTYATNRVNSIINKKEIV